MFSVRLIFGSPSEAVAVHSLGVVASCGVFCQNDAWISQVAVTPLGFSFLCRFTLNFELFFFNIGHPAFISQLPSCNSF